jgi:hypothetical protein
MYFCGEMPVSSWILVAGESGVLVQGIMRQNNLGWRRGLEKFQATHHVQSVSFFQVISLF